MSGKKKIFLFADWFEPGYKAGGPIRSCVNFANNMAAQYDLYVFSSDRDLGSRVPYEEIETDRWIEWRENVRIYYCSPAGLTAKNIRRQLAAIRPDFVYLNSMFSTWFAIYPLLLKRMGRIKAKVVLSPRGMLKESALQFKPFKKKLFLKTFRLLSFHREVTFLASDEKEVQDIRKSFGASVRVALIPNFPGSASDHPVVLEKKSGELSMIFVGRIHPIKNLDYLIGMLEKVISAVRLTIVGGLEDPVFWEKCRSIIAGLPSNITVEYAGEIPNHSLPQLISRHHIFVLPTRGENFGHAIFESLSLGKPVLISDQTPWKGLSSVKAGWDLPLDRPDLFRQSVESAAAFDQEEYRRWCVSSLAYIKAYLSRTDLRREYNQLFS